MSEKGEKIYVGSGVEFGQYGDIIIVFAFLQVLLKLVRNLRNLLIKVGILK